MMGPAPLGYNPNTPRMVRVWHGRDGQPLKGTIPPDKDWPYGSRQVRRRAMLAMNFNLFSHLFPSSDRRVRRLMSLNKTRVQYRQISANMRANGIELVRQGKRSWIRGFADGVSNRLKEMFGLNEKGATA